MAKSYAQNEAGYDNHIKTIKSSLPVTKHGALNEAPSAKKGSGGSMDNSFFAKRNDNRMQVENSLGGQPSRQHADSESKLDSLAGPDEWATTERYAYKNSDMGK